MLSLSDTCAVTGMRPYQLAQAIARHHFPLPTMISGREFFYEDEVNTWIAMRAPLARLGVLS